MDDESVESMELMEELPLKELGEAELKRLVRGWRGEPGVDSRDDGKHTARNDLLFVKTKEDDVDGRASVTKDEERVLRGG